MISFIVPCLNSAQFLKPCLDSIQNQNIKETEIIVIDCGSQDTTIEIAKNYTSRILHCPTKNVSAARNLGLAIVANSKVVLVDSDVILSPDWLSMNLNALRQGPFQVSQSPVIPKGESSFLTNYRQKFSEVVTHGHYIHLDNFALPRVTVNTAACLIDLSQFKDLKFDERMQKAEDADFMTQLYFAGANFTCTQKSNAEVFSNLDLIAYLKRALKQGFYSAYFNKKWKTKRAPLSSFFKPFNQTCLKFKTYHFLVVLLYHLGYYSSFKSPPERILKPKKTKNIVIVSDQDGQNILSPFSRIIKSTQGYYLVDPFKSQFRHFSEGSFHLNQDSVWEFRSLVINKSTSC